MNGLVSNTFSLEQKYGFKFEKKLRFDIYRDNFWGHIAQP